MIIEVKRWVVECDGDKWRFSSRAAAREHAGWLNRHPSNTNIRAFGPYKNVDGRARVRDAAAPR